MEVREDGGAEDGEDAAIDVAEQREQQHGDAGEPLAEQGGRRASVTYGLF